MVTLVDSNVLIDIVTGDPVWARWSLRAIGVALIDGAVAINDVIYAEIAPRFVDVEACDDFLRQTELHLQPMPRVALFLAARAHLDYRRRGGTRTGVLSDFFIGAQADVEGWMVLTRDVAHFRTAFPSLRLITP